MKCKTTEAKIERAKQVNYLKKNKDPSSSGITYETQTFTGITQIVLCVYLVASGIVSLSEKERSG